ncbi:hypothetical protein [Erythrobacter sp.]|uniref:hypothetical protein n=1 Tax=Erythrobacter sp. TaxID=1042 RepID=UPI001425ED3E|nr:hypothetical protein [Erythrobacter sp.]QIQ86934.1 MAG: hypothetical protein G9473_09725 [Erythrobacter sp.]
MEAGLPIAAAALFSLASWGIALAANREFRRHDRLPGLFSLTGRAARLDPRPLTLFLPPVLLTLIAGFAIAVALLVEGVAASGEPTIVIVGTGLAMLASQARALRLTRRWERSLG